MNQTHVLYESFESCLYYLSTKSNKTDTLTLVVLADSSYVVLIVSSEFCFAVRARRKLIPDEENHLKPEPQ
jgi:hypothetical protein